MNNAFRLILIMLIALMPLDSSLAQRPKSEIDWSSLSFLIGEWTGEGGGQPSQATSAGATYSFDLQRKVIIMRNYADYPATKDVPAFSFSAMMIIYPNSSRDGFRASFFDSDPHVIEYTLNVSEDRKTLTFVSDPQPSSPRYRLTYKREGENIINLEFEIAPPGKPEAFTKYVGGALRRKGGH